MALGREYDYYYTIDGEGVGEIVIKWLTRKRCVIQFPNSRIFQVFFVL